MKITDIKVYPVWIGNRNQCLVKVETDEGVFGWGESGLSGRELAVIGVVKHYREFLLGRDPMQIGALWQEMYRSQYFEGGRALTAAISAIDIALHDLVGKALGVPVHQLLGGKQRDLIPCFVTCSTPPGPQMIEDVQGMMREGWRVIRVTPAQPTAATETSIFEPRESIGPTATWLTKLRETVGADLVLGIDYHHRLNVAEAASFCQRMPAGVLDFLEEPIRDETPGAYEALRRMTPIPFAIGEEFSSKWQFLPYIERGITDFARIDICNVGGFTEAMKVVAIAEAHYIDLMPHNPLGPICTAATNHMAAAAPNLSWVETRMAPVERGDFTDDEIFPVQPSLVGTAYPVSDAPGLGIEVNEELMQRQSFKFWEAPHLRKRDGSHTNW